QPGPALPRERDPRSAGRTARAGGLAVPALRARGDDAPARARTPAERDRDRALALAARGGRGRLCVGGRTRVPRGAARAGSLGATARDPALDRLGLRTVARATDWPTPLGYAPWPSPFD